MAPKVPTKATIDFDTGEFLKTVRLVPSVLPMDRVDMHPRDGLFWLMAIKTAGAVRKGNYYILDYVHRSGMIVISDPTRVAHDHAHYRGITERGGAIVPLTQVPGLWKMEFFVEMIEEPTYVAPEARTAPTE